jgi:hypothetical protein
VLTERPSRQDSQQSAFLESTAALACQCLSDQFTEGEQTGGRLTIEQVPLVARHKDWKVLKRYTQLRPEGIHATLEKRRDLVG